MTVPSVVLSGSALHGVETHLLPHHLFAQIQQMPAMVHLGRNRPKKPPVAPKLSRYLNHARARAALPSSTSWRTKAAPALARMYLNNTYGCCVIAGKAHALGVWSANDADHDPPGIVQATDEEIYSQYQSICGPGDNGCNIADVLDVMRSRGFTAGGRSYTIDGYVAADWTNQTEVCAVQALFGASTIGMNLPEDWTKNSVWDVTNSQIVGGHDVTPIDYDSQGVYVSSWGRIYLITWAAFNSKTWIDEYYALLAPLWYGNDKLAPSGVDVLTLKADLDQIKNGTIPDIGPTPTPIVPPPTPNPPIPPTPGPNVNPLQSIIDGLFTQLEQAIAADNSHPLINRFLLQAVEQLQKAIDSLFTPHQGATAIDPNAIKQLADLVLGLLIPAFASNPVVSAILSGIKLLLDNLLKPKGLALCKACC